MVGHGSGEECERRRKGEEVCRSHRGRVHFDKHQEISAWEECFGVSSVFRGFWRSGKLLVTELRPHGDVWSSTRATDSLTLAFLRMA